MPAVAAISLADAQATPVTHNFVPLGPDRNGVWWFEDQSAPNAIGYWRISLELKRPDAAAPGVNSSNRMFRGKISLQEPILETVSNNTVTGISPAPTVSYVSRAYVELVMPERASLQNRKDLRKMIANLLGNALVISMLEDLQNVY